MSQYNPSVSDLLALDSDSDTEEPPPPQEIALEPAAVTYVQQQQQQPQLPEHALQEERKEVAELPEPTGHLSQAQLADTTSRTKQQQESLQEAGILLGEMHAVQSDEASPAEVSFIVPEMKAELEEQGVEHTAISEELGVSIAERLQDRVVAVVEKPVDVGTAESLSVAPSAMAAGSATTGMDLLSAIDSPAEPMPGEETRVGMVPRPRKEDELPYSSKAEAAEEKNLIGVDDMEECSRRADEDHAQLTDEEDESLVRKLLAQDASSGDDHEDDEVNMELEVQRDIALVKKAYSNSTGGFKFSKETSLLFDSDEDDAPHDEHEEILLSTDAQIQAVNPHPAIDLSYASNQQDMKDTAEKYPIMLDSITSAEKDMKQRGTTESGPFLAAKPSQTRSTVVNDALTADRRESRQRRAFFFHKKHGPKDVGYSTADVPAPSRVGSKGAAQRTQSVQQFMGPLELAEEKERELVAGALAHAHSSNYYWMRSWESSQRPATFGADDGEQASVLETQNPSTDGT